MTSRRRTSTSTLLAGWLFADLLLGVTIIMLGAQSPDPHPRAAAEAHPTTAPEARTSTNAQPPTEPHPAKPSQTGIPQSEAPQAGTPQTKAPQTGAPQTGTAQTEASQTGTAQTGTAQTGEPKPAPDAQATEKFQGATESQAPGKAGPTATGTARPLRDTVRPLPTPSPTPDRPSPRASASTKPRPSRKPAPSPCVSRLGDVQAKPITISFQLSPGMGDEALAVQVRQELLRHRDQLAGRHAGMVLTFGADGGGGNGVRLATRVNAAIRETYPRIFGAAVTRNFHDLAAPPGSISMEVYLMTYGCSPVSGS
ncbi:hypothetical protein ACFY19_35555 [Streptosporangium saharense]|uniref:hypothetical protein n=1 Tax=Streptosporangium saharense TaxID=1706840 RepID=UPI0036BC97D6